jgi:hypothetical protein
MELHLQQCTAPCSATSITHPSHIYSSAPHPALPHPSHITLTAPARRLHPQVPALRAAAERSAAPQRGLCLCRALRHLLAWSRAQHSGSGSSSSAASPRRGPPGAARRGGPVHPPAVPVRAAPGAALPAEPPQLRRAGVPEVRVLELCVWQGCAGCNAAIAVDATCWGVAYFSMPLIVRPQRL